MQPPISGIARTELEGWLAGRGEPPYRARQIRRHLFTGDAGSFAELTDLSRGLRGALEEAFAFSAVRPVADTLSQDRETHKGLFELQDGQRVESVLMPYHRMGDAGAWTVERNAVCFSTQVGCAMRCAFCATGEMGLARDLTTAEIVDQVRHWQRLLRGRGERVSHLVAMGMGEPLHAYDATLGAVRLFVDPDAFAISARRVTISTAGVVPKIDALAEEGLAINLAVSLHAPNDAVRGAIMPIDRRWGIDAVLAASRRYVRKTRRRLTFEYVLLAGVNDAPEHARELVSRVRGDGAVPLSLFHVNLIPVNRGPGGFARPSDERMERFAALLRQGGLAASVRISRGQDIAAGCGQLKTEIAQKGARAV